MKQLLVLCITLCLSACAGTQTRNQYYQQYNTSANPTAQIQHDGHCFNIWKNPNGNNSLFISECVTGNKVSSALAEGILTGLTLGLLTPDFGATSMVFVAASKKYIGESCRVTNHLKIDDGQGGTSGYEVLYEC